MIFTLDGQLRLADTPPALRRSLMDRLTIPNPACARAVRMGLPAWGIPRELLLYQVERNELILPRGMAMEVWAQRPKDTQRRDRMTLCPAPEWPPGAIALRPYQQAAADAVLQSRTPQGVLVMPCGAGKTETGLYLIRQIGQPALWIAHTTDLVQQTFDRAAARLGLRGPQLGMLAGDTRCIGTHLTVATVQTLYHMKLDSLAGRFGTVVVDECQHVVGNPAGAEMFNAVLGCLPARYRYGLTATPTRADGLESTIYLILDEPLHTVTQAELTAAGGTILPRVQPVSTAFRYAPSPQEAGRIDPARLRRAMDADAARTGLILQYLQAELDAGHTCLVLAGSLALLETLCRRLQAAGRRDARYLNGGTKKAQRAAALKELQEGAARCLLATYQLAKEGLDIPRADRLLLAQPVRDSAAIQQSVGRIMRPAPGKTDALVYDFVDELVPACRRQYAARKTIYRKLNAAILATHT